MHYESSTEHDYEPTDIVEMEPLEIKGAPPVKKFGAAVLIAAGVLVTLYIFGR